MRELTGARELDPHQRVLAAAATTLSAKLDAAAASETIAAAQAAPALARQLVELLHGLPSAPGAVDRAMRALERARRGP